MIDFTDASSCETSPGNTRSKWTSLYFGVNASISSVLVRLVVTNSLSDDDNILLREGKGWVYIYSTSKEEKS